MIIHSQIITNFHFFIKGIVIGRQLVAWAKTTPGMGAIIPQVCLAMLV